MPIYAFKCKTCGFECEEILSVNDDNILCPTCYVQMSKVYRSINIGKSKPIMGAYLDNGNFIPGHFGKMANKK